MTVSGPAAWAMRLPAASESTEGWLTFAAEGGGGAKSSPWIDGFAGMPLTLLFAAMIMEVNWLYN
ncbi:hypothetical protein GCM10023063_47700 [Arthrobacter methylotrophus]